jgi:hypothetical protein
VTPLSPLLIESLVQIGLVAAAAVLSLIAVRVTAPKDRRR